MAKYFLIHDTNSPESDRAVPACWPEVVSTPTSSLTIEHDLPFRYCKVILFDADGYELPRARINTILFAEHSPIITNQFYVEIEFNAAFSGTILLEPYLY